MQILRAFRSKAKNEKRARDHCLFQSFIAYLFLWQMAAGMAHLEMHKETTDDERKVFDEQTDVKRQNETTNDERKEFDEHNTVKRPKKVNR